MSAASAKTFEKSMSRLEEIVRALESGDPSLEEGMALYKEGAACSRFCRERLEKARHELALWQDNEAKAVNPDDLQADGAEAATDEEC